MNVQLEKAPNVSGEFSDFGDKPTVTNGSVAEEYDGDERSLNIAYTIIECIVAVVAIVGNLLVILAFASDRKLRRRTNYYIMSLALADFLLGILGIPFAIVVRIP